MVDDISTSLNSITESPTVEDSSEHVDPSEAGEDSSEVDADELAYQNAMQRIREGKSPEPEEDQIDPKKEEKSEDKKSEQKPEVKKAPEMVKFKTKGGKEIEIDFNDRDTVTGLIQKGIGATESFQEAAQIRKNAEAFVSALQKDPFKVLMHPSLKLNIRELAENYLWDQLQQDKLSPEQKSFKEREDRLKAYEEQQELEKNQKEMSEKANRIAKQRDYWTGIISTSLDKVGLPKTPWTIEETAKRMKIAIDNGHNEVTADDVVPAVKEEWLNMQKNIFGNLDGEALSNLLGKDVVSKISKNEIKKYKTTKFENTAKTPEQIPSSGRTYRTMEEMQQALREKHK